MRPEHRDATRRRVQADIDDQVEVWQPTRCDDFYCGCEGEYWSSRDARARTAGLGEQAPKAA